jgi:anti-repressor protein
MKNTGTSVVLDLNHAPRFDLVHRLGFTEEQADRMIRTRRVLPYLEEQEAAAPSVDAERLWSRIGKPYKRFRDWADHYIKPLQAQAASAEKSALGILVSEVAGTRGGTPKKVYTLSRDLAAGLAMQANTPEGEDVRRYFLDMERAALRLSEFNRSRGHDLMAADAGLQHFTRKRAAELAKAGKITVPAVSYAKDREQAAKRIVCEVLTGLKTGEWRARFGRRIRDTLDPGDLLTYGSAFTLAVNLLQVRAATNEDALREQLGRLYGSRIDPAKYADLPTPATEF